MLLSATSIAHCFALSQADFERAFDDTAVAGCCADELVHDREKIGRNLREALQKAMSEAMTPSHADILAYGIMLSLLREIDKTLLMSVFNFQLRCGNDASCRYPSALLSLFELMIADHLVVCATGRSHVFKNVAFCIFSLRLPKIMGILVMGQLLLLL